MYDYCFLGPYPNKFQIIIVFIIIHGFISFADKDRNWPQYSLHPQQYNENLSYLQTTIYTVIGNRH